MVDGPIDCMGDRNGNSETPEPEEDNVDRSAIQQAVREAGFDGWLFYDFQNRDIIAYRILGLDPEKHTSRRWFYWVPASGEPVRLVHGVEPTRLDELPGEKRIYVTWNQLHASLGNLFGDAKHIAMQYSPDCDIPYISVVDAGMVELVRRAAGVEIVSSADLVSRFEAVFDADGAASHRRAMALVHKVKDEAFVKIGAAISAGEELTEYEVAMFILDRFAEEGLDTEGQVPIVGVDGHPADPHFEPTEENTVPFARGQTVLIDLWARETAPDAIFADITWCGYVGEDPPEEYQRIWKIVCDGRDAGCELVIERFEREEPVGGWEIDDATRKVVVEAGYGNYFTHRTGHSIGHEVHGNGANIDNFETRDRRRILPGTCFSVEPGIYLEGRMAVRTEVDVLVSPAGKAEVSGEVQKDLILLP